MVKILTTEEQRSLHHRYKQNDLYRQWAPILALLQRKNGEMDAATIWFLAEKQVVRLREELSYREQEISPIFNELIEDCRMLTAKDSKVIQRSDAEAQRSAITVMCVVLTMLMNAVEKGHEEESFDNEPMCMAIMDILAENVFFQQLMNLFFSRNTGYDGKKVIITPSDPMVNDDPMVNMDEIAKEEVEQIVNRVSQLTSGLKAILKSGHWEHWISVWRDICNNSELITILKQTNRPRGSEWPVNEKMVFNVLGIFIEAFEYKNFVSTASKALTNKSSGRDYIANHGHKYGNSTELSTQEIHERVERIVKSKVKS
ncbi:hypothetical protein [Prevotella sp. E13-27]|uniref:hypothetical protein n=1 Tax=Prevotella sp. E13-27 TaxID=2938122 RepID=UPI002009F611|nr:hypothetical protein [Prevotella sp. E13-27]MCK8622821.1 hypothetical protein [Prevotella sp. E13-27]